MSKSFDSSPYCQKYLSEGNRNAILVGLRSSNFNSAVHNSSVAGYIFGELSRSSVTGYIYFIYVHDNLRGKGYGKDLCRLFEDVVKERSANAGVNVVVIRISLKLCIKNSVSFWNHHGFEGSKNSVYLTKTIKIN